MAYATQQDIIDRYGEDALLVLADRDGDGAIDADAVAAALDDASDEIDAYLSRYDLPFAAAPKGLTQPCVDIAVYRLCGDGPSLTEERRRRYEDAVRLLTKISEGKIDLGGGSSGGAQTSGASFGSSDRAFTRSAMEGF